MVIFNSYVKLPESTSFLQTMALRKRPQITWGTMIGSPTSNGFLDSQLSKSKLPHFFVLDGMPQFWTQPDLSEKAQDELEISALRVGFLNPDEHVTMATLEIWRRPVGQQKSCCKWFTFLPNKKPRFTSQNGGFSVAISVSPRISPLFPPPR